MTLTLHSWHFTILSSRYTLPSCLHVARYRATLPSWFQELESVPFSIPNMGRDSPFLGILLGFRLFQG